MKTNKSLKKRIKITKNKKIIKRPLNQAHFNAKKTGNATRSKRKQNRASKSQVKIIKKVLQEI